MSSAVIQRISGAMFARLPEASPRCCPIVLARFSLGHARPNNSTSWSCRVDLADSKKRLAREVEFSGILIFSASDSAQAARRAHPASSAAAIERSVEGLTGRPAPTSR
jgi:hypothetical protein